MYYLKKYIFYDPIRQWTGGRIGNLYSPNPEPVSTGWGWRLPWSRDPRQHQEPRFVITILFFIPLKFLIFFSFWFGIMVLCFIIC